MNESFVDKYRPRSLSDIKGHPSAIKEITRWAENWSHGDKPIMLHGPAGTGKTSTAEALANDMGWAIDEINASSETQKDDIRYIVQSIRSGSLDSEYTLFLLDEVDSINGRSLGPLKKILDDPPNPIILTANEKWKVPDGIANKCDKIKYNLQKRSIKPVLKSIAKEEDIDISNREIGMLATRNGLRDAINDLQEFAESDADLDWDQRQTDIGNFDAVDNLLRGKKYSGEMTPPDMVDWLDENIHATMDGVEAVRAFQCLSEADKFVQLANETQDYSWWRYAGAIAEEVANVRITEPRDWINKSYPKSRRNKPSKSTYQNPQATLYRELKDTGMYVGSFSYQEFKRDILPMLKELPKEERMELILDHSLSSDAMRALDIISSEYDSWLSEEEKVDDDECIDDNEKTCKSSEGSLQGGIFDY